jgi:hypothetical protein
MVRVPKWVYNHPSALRRLDTFYATQKTKRREFESEGKSEIEIKQLYSADLLAFIAEVQHLKYPRRQWGKGFNEGK